MAVAFVTNTSEKSQLQTPGIAITVGAGDTNPYIQVDVAVDTGVGLVTNVTSDKGTGTIAEITNVRSAAGTAYTSVWRIPAPVVATHTITVTINTAAVDHQIDVKLFKGVDQSTPSPSADAVTSQSTSTPNTVTGSANLTANDASSGCSATVNGDVVSIAPNSTYSDDFTGVNILSGYATGTGNLTFTYSGATTQAIVVTRIVAAAGGGASSITGVAGTATLTGQGSVLGTGLIPGSMIAGT